MVSRDFLKHHHVGIGLREKLRHVGHVVVAVPQIEGDDAQETWTVGRRIGGTARHTDADE
jgi:hypothetical protein